MTTILPDYGEELRRRTRRDTATPISRPVFMIFRSYNPNPVIGKRTR